MPNVMPSFQGQISEEGILQLIVYIKSLAIPSAPGAPTALNQGASQQTLFAQPVSAQSVRPARASQQMAVNNEHSFTRTRN